jgi:glycosyltransferase involved in cell wall biosynthesis
MTKYLLAYMDYSTHTGFSSVAENLMERLSNYFHEKDIEVHIHALNYFGESKMISIKGVNTLLYSAKTKAKNLNDPYYRDGFLKVLNDFDYDYVWVINDLSAIAPMMPIVRKIHQDKKKKFKSILYFPIDSQPNPSHLSDLSFWDLKVTYTEYARKQVIKHVDETIEVIPHGANRQHFYKLDNVDKNNFREKYGLPKDKFIFANINKNNPRKNIGGTLLAYAKFLNLKKKLDSKIETCLYLHLSPTDASGINVFKACETLGITNDVYIPTRENYKNGVGYSVSEMNEIYNCVDCYITTTGAEGWGLSITEAMATHLPIIAPMNTSILEITENGSCVYAIWNLIEHFEIHDGENVRLVADPTITAKLMYDAFYDRLSGKEVDVAAYEDILDEYNWDKIAETWKKKFNKIM